eukprot:TRINITY_DN12992_c0_g1_i1.p1 TRINITY_DN12992_c0_g1~~TRINITY_DN12992_c0_g1_i1.p1  ORF type:complete len:112 (-),score=39.10 TRINITY_DN12992_c0_g1_i1:53-388(-)
MMVFNQFAVNQYGTASCLVGLTQGFNNFLGIFDFSRFRCVGIIGVRKLEGMNQRLAIKTHIAADTAGTVSYTHLRAHETVLDLVCRLLLEKKKKNNTQKKTNILTASTHIK